MGVIQIHILLANTTWCIRNVLTATTAPSRPIICLADTIAPSINLVRLVWQVSDNHSLNIKGACTIIRWERTTCKSDRADTNGSNTPGLPEQADTEATLGPVGSQMSLSVMVRLLFFLFCSVYSWTVHTHTHTRPARFHAPVEWMDTLCSWNSLSLARCEFFYLTINSIQRQEAVNTYMVKIELWRVVWS